MTTERHRHEPIKLSLERGITGSDEPTMSDPLHRHVFEEVSVGIAVHEPGTARIASVNQAFADALGVDPTELEGRSLVDLNQGESTGLSEAVQRALEGEPEQAETVLMGNADSPRQVTLALETISTDSGQRLLASIRSDEDREHDLGETSSAQRLEVALAGTNTGVWEWDMDSDRVIWTESMEQLFGLDPGTFEGTFEAFAKRVHPDDLPDVESRIEEAVENDEMFRTEYRIRRDDGEERWVHARGEPQNRSDGTRRLIGIVTDITELKQKERALREQEDRYRQLVDRLPVAHYALDSEWRITFCNEPVAERLGTSVDELRGELLWDVLPEAKDSVVERTLRRVMETGSPERFEYQYEARDHWVSVQAYPYADGVAAVSQDISDQRETLLSILDTTPIIVYRFDSDGIIQEARGEMLSELDLEPDDVVGKSIFEVFTDVEDIATTANRALEGESLRFTVTVDDLTFETRYRPLYTDGEVTSVIGVAMDVTELHQQREQMEFFNSILRHDVLNGMTVIKMRADVLAEELDGEHGQYAQTIVDWCNTTTDVTKRVRRVVETLTTPEQEYHLEPVDVSAILQRKSRELENAYPEVTFETTVPDRVLVQADELLSDALGNLLTNSIEHNETEGLRIEADVDIEDDAVRIRISDNGVGIADERKASVFRRGETSHAKETGSGFGLFFVDVMVEKYGGEIWVEDSDAGGACFVLQLPMAGDNS